MLRLVNAGESDDMPSAAEGAGMPLVSSGWGASFANADQPTKRAWVQLPDQLPDRTHDVAIDDWNDLLNAVKARLTLIGGEWLANPPQSQLAEIVIQSRVNVLECVAALDQLQTTLEHELDRRGQLADELVKVRANLAQAHAELAGTQAEERRAKCRSLHDGLTSLPNRDFFGEMLDHALALQAPSRKSLAVLYLDLDGFKPINEQYGHAIGDELLKIIAERLTRAVRAEDMVSRLGDDEFACLLGGLSARTQLVNLVNKVYDAVAAPCRIGALTLSLYPSIGIASCPPDGAKAEELVENAGSAMYQAKRLQSRYAFFEECG